jgi:hypothetical protein
MEAKSRTLLLLGALVLVIDHSTSPLSAQDSTAPAVAASTSAQTDPLADLSPENHALFDAIRDAAQHGNDAVVLADCKKLLPALKPDTELADFITHLAANAALETGDTAYSLTLIKPVAEAHPDDWRASTMLARLYAETGDTAHRDQQIAQVIALHQRTSDPDFARLHVFPIQKVMLHSGYAVFLYPFEPLKPYNTYLVALVYTSDGKSDYRLELGSEDADQAFFKPKHPGERRFSIDSYRKNEKNPDLPETQALHGFVDGKFDYDKMRDLLVKTANGEKPLVNQ